MKIPLRETRKRGVHVQIASLIQEALALGISPTQLGNMTALAWMRAREGRAE